MKLAAEYIHSESGNRIPDSPSFPIRRNWEKGGKQGIPVSLWNYRFLELSRVGRGPVGMNRCC